MQKVRDKWSGCCHQTPKNMSGFGTVEDGSWKDLEDSISKNLKGLKEAVSRSLVSLEKASYQD